MTIQSSLITETSVVVMLNGKTHCITSAHINYERIRKALIDKDYTGIEDLLDIRASVVRFGEGKITVVGDEVRYDNEPLHGAITTRILKMIEEGFDVTPLAKFLENLMANPSKRAVDELYGFLEACELPITEDGHFHAFKRVVRKTKPDGTTGLFDIYTETIPNDVGCIPTMRRNQVNENKDQTCSQGLHFCSQSYLPYFGVSDSSVVLVIKINPADVVSIPTDYENAKGRCCRYEVIAEYPIEDYAAAFPKSVDTRTTDDFEEEFDSDDDDWDDDESEFGYDAQYNAGYDAGASKAVRHNQRGWGYIERVDSDFGEGYWDGYHGTRHSGSPKEDPALTKTATKPKSQPARDPNTGRYVRKQ